MKAVTAVPTLNRRGLILHDGLAFLTLLVSSAALLAVTLFLFRSFEAHRAELAKRWAERGRIALRQGAPEEAVSALRTALVYAPDERADQFLLAQSLEAAGHIDEATNYFLSLWESRPGDGFINLELAKLERKKGENSAAIDYYRASIFGSWQGDGVVRRRQVRLELVGLLIEQRQFDEARNELFIVAGNAPDDIQLNLLVASQMQAAGFPADALGFYEKVLARDRHHRSALVAAGKLTYSLGEYDRAENLLVRAAREKPAENEDPELQAELGLLTRSAVRIQQLALTRDQPPATRADHILLAAGIAQDRLRSCEAQTGATLPGALQLAALAESWRAAPTRRDRFRALLKDADAQNNWMQLIFRTEQQTAALCGRPAGDDAFLLKLADGADRSEKVQ